MAKAPKRKVAGIGDNSDALPDQGEYRSALAMFVLLAEEKKAMSARHVKLRKRVCESKGIAQADVKVMLEMKDDSLADIVHRIKRMATALGTMFGKTFQLDMFTPDPEQSEAVRLKGMLSGVSGEPAQAPPTLTNEQRNIWLEGHRDGADAREATIKEMSDEFTDGQENDYSDAALKTRAGRKAKSKAVGLQAAADFDADQQSLIPTPEETAFSEAQPDELAAQRLRRSQSEKAEDARKAAGI